MAQEDDFEMFQGENATPYYVITTDGTASGMAVDLSGWSAAVWVAASVNGSTVTPVITKHKADMTLGVDPNVPGAVIQNCVFVPLVPSDTGVLADLGQFQHELRITLTGKESVVYPLAGETATFSVLVSITWNPGAQPPADRVEHFSVPPSSGKLVGKFGSG